MGGTRTAFHKRAHATNNFRKEAKKMEESGAELQSLLASITGTDIRNAIPVQNIERGGRKEPDLVE